MRRGSFRMLAITFIFILAISSLVSCASGYQVASTPARPSPSASKVPSATPVAPSGAGKASPIATAVAGPAVTHSLGGPLVTPTPEGVWIEVVSKSSEHSFITPGGTAVVPFSNEVAVLVHYPYPLGSEEAGSFQPYHIDISVNPSTRQVERGNWPRADVLSFRLAGDATGRFVVTINVPEKGQSTTFTVDILEPAPKAVSTPGATRTVSLADNGQTIELQTGQHFLLALGTGYDWRITVADQTIVSRVPNITVIQGAQGVYEAKKPGRTTLNATGDPECLKAQPPCGLPSRTFHVEIVVH